MGEAQKVEALHTELAMAHEELARLGGKLSDEAAADLDDAIAAALENTDEDENDGTNQEEEEEGEETEAEVEGEVPNWSLESWARAFDFNAVVAEHLLLRVREKASERGLEVTTKVQHLAIPAIRGLRMPNFPTLFTYPAPCTHPTYNLDLHPTPCTIAPYNLHLHPASCTLHMALEVPIHLWV